MRQIMTAIGVAIAGVTITLISGARGPLWSQAGAQSPAQPPTITDDLGTYHIAIVSDSESPYFEELVRGFREELEALAQGNYTVNFRDDLNAHGDLSKVPNLIRQALQDPKIDLIYAAGLAASTTAARLSPEERTKPIVGGAIEFADLDNSMLGGSGTSTLANYTFIHSPRRIAADLERLAQLTNSSRIDALVHRAAVDHLGPRLTERVTALSQRLGLQIEIVAGGDSAEECLAALNAETQALYVTHVVANAPGAREELYRSLAERGIAALSIRGVPDVYLGALAGLAPDNAGAMHRRTALNIHQILAGIPTELLPVTLKAEDQLTINLDTAKILGWSPDYDTSLSAIFVEQSSAHRDADPLTLEEAMALASRQNPDVLAATARRTQDSLQVDIVRTTLRPSLGVSADGGSVGVSERINPLTPLHTESLSLGVQLQQVLFSDRINSQLRAQQQLAKTSALNLESIRLDTMESSGRAFLQVLITEALHDIDRENLQLIENNLQLAKLRQDIGTAESSEVFRWESSQARARAQLIQRDSDRRNARVQLNVFLGVDRAKSWRLTDIPLGDDQFYFMHAEVAALVTNRREFQHLLLFIKAKAAQRSPEITAFERNLDAQGIVLAERRRRNFLPEISATGSFARRLEDPHAVGRDSQNEWSVGIGFSIPLFGGGARRAETAQLEAGLRELSAQRDAALYLVEQRALAAGYGISASHPAMRLSRRAVRAARRNYDAIQSKYTQGAASIIDLLDAQAELITQRQSEAISAYQYLQDIVSLQRALAWFEFDQTPDERARWAEEMRVFMTAQKATAESSHR